MNNLYSLEKNDYFMALLKDGVRDKKMEEYFDFERIVCIDNATSLREFYVFTDKENGEKTIYTVSNEDNIEKISQEKIKEKFDNGMKILSENKKEEHMKILLSQKDKSKWTMQSVINKIGEIPYEISKAAKRRQNGDVRDGNKLAK